MSDRKPAHEKVTYIGKVDYRNKPVTFGIKENDRTRHTYIIGKTGMGKSTLLENLAIQDIVNGEGLCVIDPHGSMAEKLLDHIPESRVKDVVYFAPFDSENPIGLNVLERVAPEKRHLVANGLMAAFKKLFVDQFSARMEYVLNNIILALLENDNQTLLGVNRMLFDKDYRKFIVSNVTDPTIRDFWINEYANYTDKTAQELAPAIQNKVGQFVANPLIRNIIGQQKTSFDIRELMDQKKILIVNLSKGRVGEGNANLLGSLLITKIYLSAMSRADSGPYEVDNLPPFYFYVDEFQNFANESFASILSEARKYKLALTVAHQYVEQMTDEVKAAVFGNVGTMITFRVGATDAELFEKEFAPYFTMDDIVNLSARQIYLRLMIDGQGSKPFSAHTLDQIQKPAYSFAEQVIAHSRKTYAKPKKIVEEEIQEFYKPIPKEEKKVDKAVPVREIRDDTPLIKRKSNTLQPSSHSQEKIIEKDREKAAAQVYVQPQNYPFLPEEKKYTRPENHVVTAYSAQREVSPRTQTFSSKPLASQNNKEPLVEKKNSLKEALEKAMQEHASVSEEDVSSNRHTKVTVEPTITTSASVKKEVPEDILRKLLEEE